MRQNCCRSPLADFRISLTSSFEYHFALFRCSVGNSTEGISLGVIRFHFLAWFAAATRTTSSLLIVASQAGAGFLLNPPPVVPDLREEAYNLLVGISTALSNVLLK